MMPYIRPRPLTYVVLDKDNIDELRQLTGKTENELRAEYDECVKFGMTRVFWRQYDRWWSIRIDGMYAYQGLLDEVIYEAMRSTSDS